MRVRIGRKSLAGYPSKVAAKLRIIAERFNTHTFEQKDELPTRKFYVAEGNAYYGMREDGSGYDFEVVAEHNVGAAGLSNAIGSEFCMPAGTWLAEISYYQRYSMTVYRILADEKEQKRLRRDQALPLENIRMALGRGFK